MCGVEMAFIERTPARPRPRTCHPLFVYVLAQRHIAKDDFQRAGGTGVSLLDGRYDIRQRILPMPLHPHHGEQTGEN